jgi:hypothetical protein
MSSTTNESATAPPTPSRPTCVLTNLLALTVLFFLLAGLVIVVGQAVMLAAGDATAARAWASAVAPYAFGGAAIAGVLSFLLSYAAGDEHDAHIDDDSDVEVEDGRA